MKRLFLYIAMAWSAAAAPHWGGELRFCLHADPKTLDPLLVSDQPGGMVRYLTGGVLIRLNRATQTLEPELAESWRVTEGGRAIEFRIRDGVRFSDGSPFTPDDAVYSLKTLFDPKLHFAAADVFGAGSGAVTVERASAHSVRVRLPKTLAGVANLFDEVVMLSRNWPAARRGAAGMPGLGPYRVTEYRPGAYLLLSRNPYYWRTAEGGRRLPYIDSVRLSIQQNRALELMRFMKGDLNLIDALDPDDYERLARGRGTWRVLDLGPGLGAEQIWFNQASAARLPEYKRAWFGNREFRLAISEAINRADISRVVFRGKAVPAVGSVSPANRFWFDPKLPAADYSPQKALAQLSRAGFRQVHGTLRDNRNNPVELSIVTNSGNQLRERTAALIQEDLARIGVRVTVTPLDFPSLIERITRTFDYEMCLLSFSNVDLDPNGQMNIWLSSANAHAWNPEQKAPATAWEAEIDRLMWQQAAETSPGKRKAAFSRVQEIAARQAPMLFLVHRNILCAVSPSLRNISAAAVYPELVWNIARLYFEPPARMEAGR